jgi:hypothetical protein
MLYDGIKNMKEKIKKILKNYKLDKESATIILAGICTPSSLLYSAYGISSGDAKATALGILTFCWGCVEIYNFYNAHKKKDTKNNTSKMRV